MKNKSLEILLKEVEDRIKEIKNKTVQLYEDRFEIKILIKLNVRIQQLLIEDLKNEKV